MGVMSKVKVAIVTDSTANLPVDVLKEHNIYVIPQILNWEGKSLLDQIDISTEEFYQRLPQSKDLPKTSQPAPGQFTEHFNTVAEDGGEHRRHLRLGVPQWYASIGASGGRSNG